MSETEGLSWTQIRQRYCRKPKAEKPAPRILEAPPRRRRRRPAAPPPPAPSPGPAASDSESMHWRPWSDVDLSTLRAMMEKGEPIPQIATALRRSEAAVREKARLMGLRRVWTARTTERQWTVEEVNRLRKMYHRGRTIADIAAALDRTESAVRNRLSINNIRRKGVDARRHFTDEEKALLEDLWHKGVQRSDIAAILGRPPATIDSARQRLGLYGRRSNLLPRGWRPD